jgi:lysozyme
MDTTSSVLNPSVQVMSATGLKLLAGREGARLKAYQDTRGIWTIGIGHTAAAGLPHPCEGMTLTEQSMMALFAVDLQQYEDAVRLATKSASLANHEFDACGSLCYNIGVAGFHGSAVAAYICEHEFTKAADAFLNWCHPSELLGRRRAERNQFLMAYGA